MIKAFTFIGLLMLLAVVFAVWSGTPWMGQGHEHSFAWPGDGSDWNFNGNPWAGWIIGALALLLVGVLLTIVFAGVGVILFFTLFLIAGVVVLALLPVLVPLLVLLALPVLAIYGLATLFSKRTV